MGDTLRGYEFFEICDVIEKFCTSTDPRDRKLLTLVFLRINGCKNVAGIRELLASLLFPIGISLEKHRSFLFYFRYKLQKYYPLELLENQTRYSKNRILATEEQPEEDSSQEYDEFYIYNLSHNSSVADRSLANSPKPYEYICVEPFCYDHEDCKPIQSCDYEITGTRLDWDTGLRVICSTIISKKWRRTIKSLDQIPPSLASTLSRYPHFHLSTWHSVTKAKVKIPVYFSSPSGSPSGDEDELHDYQDGQHDICDDYSRDHDGDSDHDDDNNDHDPSENDEFDDYSHTESKFNNFVSQSGKHKPIVRTENSYDSIDQPSSSSSTCLTPSTTDQEYETDSPVQSGSPYSTYPQDKFYAESEIIPQHLPEQKKYSLANLANYTPSLDGILSCLDDSSYCTFSREQNDQWKLDASFYELMAIVYAFAKVYLSPSIASIIKLSEKESHCEISNYFYGVLCDETFLLSNLVAMMFRKGRLSLHNSLYFGMLYTEPCETIVTDMSLADFKQKHRSLKGKIFVNISRSITPEYVTRIEVDRLSEVYVTRRYPIRKGYLLREIFDSMHKISSKLLELLNSGGQIFDLSLFPKQVKNLFKELDYVSYYDRISESLKLTSPRKWEPYKIRHFTVDSLLHLLHRQGLFLELERLNVFMKGKNMKDYVWIEFNGRYPSRYELELTLSMVKTQEKTISEDCSIIIQSLEGRSHLVFKLSDLSLFKNVSLSCVYSNPKKLSRNIPIFPIHMMLNYTRSIHNRHPNEQKVSLRCLVKSVLCNISANSRSDIGVMEIDDPLFDIYELLPLLLSRWDDVKCMSDAIKHSYQMIISEKKENCIFGVLLGFIKIRCPKYLSGESILSINRILKSCSSTTATQFPDLCGYFARFAASVISRKPLSQRYEISFLTKDGCDDLWMNLSHSGNKQHMPCFDLYQFCCSILVSHETARNILLMIQPNSPPKHRLDPKGKLVQTALRFQLGEYISSFGTEQHPETYIWARTRYVRPVGIENEHQLHLMIFMQIVEWISLHGKSDRAKVEDTIGPCYVDPFVLNRKPLELPVYLREDTHELFYYNRTLFVAKEPLGIEKSNNNTKKSNKKTSIFNKETAPVKEQSLDDEMNRKDLFLLFLFHHGPRFHSSIHRTGESAYYDSLSGCKSFYDNLKSCTRQYESDQYRAKYLGCKFKKQELEEPPKKIQKLSQSQVTDNR